MSASSPWSAAAQPWMSPIAIVLEAMLTLDYQMKKRTFPVVSAEVGERQKTAPLRQRSETSVRLSNLFRIGLTGSGAVPSEGQWRYTAACRASVVMPE